jgi:hypothetical protein
MEPVAALVRPCDDLAALAAEINAAHQAAVECVRGAKRHAKAAGEKLLLAKERCIQESLPWHEWLASHCKDIPVRTANYLMRQARSHTGNVANVPLDEEVKEMASEADDEEPNWVDKECHSVEWYTPPDLLECVRGYFGGPIPLDPASAEKYSAPNNRPDFWEAYKEVDPHRPPRCGPLKTWRPLPPRSGTSTSSGRKPPARAWSTLPGLASGCWKPSRSAATGNG